MPNNISLRDANNNGSATDRGTKIVQKGDDLDKNAFLKILAAQLSNQDPTQNVDSTQYVSQMAQFTSMEQMNNLNNTMSNYAMQNLVGKGATVKLLDPNGMPYTGVIKSVNQDSSGTTISLEVSEDGKNTYKEVKYEDIISVVDVPDYSLPVINNLNGNMSFLLASSFIGKNVEIKDKGEDGKDITLNGEVKGTFKEDGTIKVRVLLDSGEIKEFSYDKISKVGDFTSKEDDKNTESKK